MPIRTLTTALASLALLVGASGCSVVTDPVVAGASVVSLVNTDKTLGDHFVSWALAKDCSILYSANDESYCRDENAEQAIAANTGYEGLYCYRSIGGTTCYRSPYEEASSQTVVYHSPAPPPSDLALTSPAEAPVQ